MRHCNVGGTEGAKCSTEHQLAHFCWASKLLSLLIQGSKGRLFDSLSDNSLDDVIRWYLLNNTEELNPVNPAYRTPAYELLAQIEARVMELF